FTPSSCETSNPDAVLFLRHSVQKLDGSWLRSNTATTIPLTEEGVRCRTWRKTEGIAIREHSAPRKASGCFRTVSFQNCEACEAASPPSSSLAKVFPKSGHPRSSIARSCSAGRLLRSEERRVGKECRYWGGADSYDR